MVHYKLTYFNARGNGEIIRQIFAVAGKSYDDFRVPKEQWLQFKQKMPFGTVPVLEVDGFQLAQTHTIARYLSRQFGLAGKDAWFQAQVDSYADQWKDFLADISTFSAVLAGMAKGNLKKLQDEVFIPAVNKHFPIYVKAIKENTFGSGYIVGCSLTYVDLLVAEFMANLEKTAPQLLDNYPSLRAHRKLVQSNPELRRWLEIRPNTPL